MTYHGQAVGTLSLRHDNRLCAFEYAKTWLSGDGFSISPLELPLKPGLFVAGPTPFYGNFGVFEDSLPDGYGRYLLHKTLLKEGIDDTTLSSLDRLSIVGSNGMGALCYHPETYIDNENDTADLDFMQEKALAVLREQEDSDAGLLLYNSGNSGGCRPKVVFTDDKGHWLVKFRHTYDPSDMGKTEYHYNQVAKACGISIPDIRLMKGRYFASRRFDIDRDGSRIHTVTAGGLLAVSLANPVLDYNNLLALTGYLTQQPEEVEEMFRRMVFNYLTGNKDDHCKNFTFLIKKHNGAWRWRLAPAYDLTLCEEGYNGEHATSVNGTGRPTLADMMAVGVRNKMGERRCKEIFEQVRANCADILHTDIS